MFQPRQDDVQPENGAAARLRGQEGFVLLAVLFMLVLIVLALAVAAPKMAIELQREKEIETIHRGMEYARAIRMYYRKFGSYPTTIDQLVKTDNERFLRKRYLDPLTGKDDWRLIHLGQAQTMGTGVPGASPTGVSGAPGQSGLGTSNSGFSGPAPSGLASGSGNSGFSLGSSGSGDSGSGNSGFSLGSSGSNNSGSGNSGFSLGSSGSDNSGSGNSGFSLGSSGSGNSAAGSPSGSPPGSNGTGSSPLGSFGQNLSGGPIVGVGLPSTKASLKIFRKQSHYNQWEFVYDPSQDLGGAMGQTGAGILQQPSTSNDVNGTTPGNGGASSSGTGGFSLGGSSSGGSNGGFSLGGSISGGGSGSTNNGGSTQPANPPPTQMDSPQN